MPNEQDIPWEGRCSTDAYDFAKKCLNLKKTNPHNLDALERVINDLMTELWDNGFSQSEIRNAFEKAVADMPRYAAGEERRGDRG